MGSSDNTSGQFKFVQTQKFQCGLEVRHSSWGGISNVELTGFQLRPWSLLMTLRKACGQHGHDRKADCLTMRGKWCVDDT
jgi:hypothetical protein